jgi:RecA DNA recombination protein
MIISQIKDKINAMFGESKMRTGGHAMDFYATHCLWLAHIGQVKKTVDGIERVVAVEVKANCKKNKVGLPFRTCSFNILFGYGIDDLSANVEWLIEIGKHDLLKAVDMTKSGYKLRVQALRNRGGAELRDVRQKLNSIVVNEWARIETSFLPQSRKY